MSSVIQVDDLSKKYRLGVFGTGTLRHDLNQWWHRVRGKPDPYARITAGLKTNGATGYSDSQDEMWALRGVSFEVKQGEILGVIGRNGAGKSTLLKILSRVTAPTSGEVRVKGRIASLLEVGTGFHPELTGRENVFLNGAILGMTKGEIRRKFDEILAFSGVEEYIDTPVKRYSSGMYVRLAFAVAAHLEPEILIVDEVLAVGDSEFQSKCLGKMKDVSASGRTVLFVSHNLTAILNLCSKGVLLNEGRTLMIGQTQKVCAAYADTWQRVSVGRRSSGFLRSISLVTATGADRCSMMEGEPLRFRCGLCVPEERCVMSLIIKDARNAPLFELFDGSFSLPGKSRDLVNVEAEAESPLLPGHYSVDFWLGDRMCQRIEAVKGAFEFDVVASQKTESSATLNGSVRCASEWRVV
jgi:lipopolysaccharide transport system ATP-binding protein